MDPGFQSVLHRGLTWTAPSPRTPSIGMYILVSLHPSLSLSQFLLHLTGSYLNTDHKHGSCLEAFSRFSSSHKFAKPGEIQGTSLVLVVYCWFMTSAMFQMLYLFPPPERTGTLIPYSIMATSTIEPDHLLASILPFTISKFAMINTPDYYCD